MCMGICGRKRSTRSIERFCCERARKARLQALDRIAFIHAKSVLCAAIATSQRRSWTNIVALAAQCRYADFRAKAILHHQ